MPVPKDVTFFRSSAEFRRWLEEHHAKSPELWIGFNKITSGKGGLTYKEALDQALCFGWIDGIRKNLDNDTWTIRFTPRKPTSIWSRINITRVGQLTKLGLMKPSGLEAFERRDEKRTNRYSFENRPQELPPKYQKPFRAKAKAWAFFQAQPPSYRRTTTWWIVSAVKDETRLRRLAILIERCEKGERIDLLAPQSKREG
jgi:uncharacterized protein YdeI (YjbR/CyaY-like superfamily)